MDPMAVLPYFLDTMGHREVAYLFISLSRGKGTKILTVVFLSDEVKSDSCLFIKNVFQIFYHFIIQINVREKNDLLIHDSCVSTSKCSQVSITNTLSPVFQREEMG